MEGPISDDVGILLEVLVVERFPCGFTVKLPS